ncbi:MAG: tRNA (adenosine(37)-N6)-threonylcarbamoyltransferase complex transferase subunit TsaD [Chloroflexi bacterium]|nr:tRNA (adenosine(37)-N6)-threonylcarbamoyltransferase complex transferase subunit TsaD [Chloroflexota bacterium]
MKVLGIETSCDETAASVVEDGDCILSNVVASQVDIHSRYGGIVPEVASRQHLLSIVPIVRQAMDQAGVTHRDLSAVAVTVGPGLIGSLLVGANFAKGLAASWGLRLIGVNHLEAHIYANWLEREVSPEFPALCLIVSGGHTDLVLMAGHGHYRLLGRTRDDAAGEAFDKAARILGLGYPGGPAIQQAASEGNPAVVLPRAWLKGTNDFSFSGLKTALFHLIRKTKHDSGFATQDVAAAFQEAVVDVLVSKTVEAAIRNGVSRILLAGGVASNQLLRSRMLKASPVPVVIPEPALCTDNAAMVASCGHYRFCYAAGPNLDVSASLSLT